MVEEVPAEAGAGKSDERDGWVGPANKVSLGEHYLKLIESWVLAVGIFAFGGFAYHTPMIKPGLVASWRPVAYICFFVGFTVFWAAVDILTDLLIPIARRKKLALVLGFLVSVCGLVPAMGFSAMLSAEWADNNARIDWCRAHPDSSEPLCKPVRE